MAAKYILRLDDVAPNMEWTRFNRLKETLDRYSVCPLIGVIPDNHDPNLLALPECQGDFWQVVRELDRRGWSVAQHGYRHYYETAEAGVLGMNPQSEFAGLSYEVQKDKLERGRRRLRDNGVNSEIFMAPAHSFDAHTLDALKSLEFTTITDGFGLYPYYSDGLLIVPQLFATPRAMPLGIYTFCIHVNTISDVELARLTRFIERHHNHFIAFSDAATYARGAPPHSNSVLKFAFNKARRIRGAMRRKAA